MSTRRRLLIAGVALVAMIVPLAASAAPPAGEPGNPELLAALPGGAGSGSAVGPGGSLYVTQPATGEIWRVDPESGEKAVYASGLPRRFGELPFGGVMDVAFIGSTAYALVSVVGSVFPDDLFACHPRTVGIYRVNGPTSSTVVADIGTFACENPPSGFPFAVPMGVQFALETYRGGFLVTDGHHNRVLRVTLDGTVAQLIGFGDVVPTGLATSGNTIYLAEAGPVPHEPQNGKIVSFEPGSSTDDGRRIRRSTRRGRGDGPRADAVRPLAGSLPLRGRSGLRRSSGVTRHRSAHAGERGRRLHDDRRRARSAVVARDHPQHRVCRHPGRRSVDDRQRRRPAVRLIRILRGGAGQGGRCPAPPRV